MLGELPRERPRKPSAQMPVRIALGMVLVKAKHVLGKVSCRSTHNQSETSTVIAVASGRNDDRRLDQRLLGAIEICARKGLQPALRNRARPPWEVGMPGHRFQERMRTPELQEGHARAGGASQRVVSRNHQW